MTPCRASEAMTASKTCRAFAPRSCGFAATAIAGTAGAAEPIHESVDHGRRTTLNPSATKWDAIASTDWHCSPPGTRSSDSAPYQLTPASFTRLPAASRIHRPDVWSGKAGSVVLVSVGGGNVPAACGQAPEENCADTTVSDSGTANTATLPMLPRKPRPMCTRPSAGAAELPPVLAAATRRPSTYKTAVPPATDSAS